MFWLYRLDGLEDPLNFKKKKKKKKNFMAPFYGWGSTASRLEPLQMDKKERSLVGLVGFECPQTGEKKLLLEQENLGSV